MESFVEELAERITRATQADRSTIVGIDGHGAAGKSLLAERLGAVLEKCDIVHFDDFYLPEPEKSGHGRRFDWRRLERQVLRPARSGEQVRYQKLDWSTNRLSDWINVATSSYILVEGVYALRAELWSYYDFRVLVRAPYSVRLARGVQRDGESLRSMWVDTWMPEEAAYFASATGPDESAVDEIGDGTDPGIL